MNEKTKKVLKIIAFILVVLIVLVITLLIWSKKDNNDGNQSNISKFNYVESDEQDNQTNNTFKVVNDYSVYFSANIILNDYIEYFEKINKDVEFAKDKIQLSDEELENARYKSSLNAISQFFDEQYKETEAYDNNKIASYVEKYKNKSGNSKYIIYISEMYQANIDQNCMLVLIYSKINNNDFNCMIKMDFDSKRYSIFWDDYLEKHNYTKNRTEQVDINRDIKGQDYNIFTPVYPNNQDIAIQYFEDLKYKIKYNPNELYNYLLDEEYKTKKFPSVESYSEFLKDMNEKLDNMDITQVQFEDNQIVLGDNYDNIYTFKISSAMKYKVLLDNYTIKNE